MNEIEQKAKEIAEIIASEKKRMDEDFQEREAQIDAKIKKLSVLEVQVAEMDKKAKEIEAERKLIEAEKEKLREKQDYLDKKDQQIKDQSAKLQDILGG